MFLYMCRARYGFFFNHHHTTTAYAFYLTSQICSVFRLLFACSYDGTRVDSIKPTYPRELPQDNTEQRSSYAKHGLRWTLMGSRSSSTFQTPPRGVFHLRFPKKGKSRLVRIRDTSQRALAHTSESRGNARYIGTAGHTYT